MSATSHSKLGLSWLRIAGFACYQGFVYSVFYWGSNEELTLGPLVLERAELLLTLLFMLLSFAAVRVTPAIMNRLLESKPILALCSVLLLVGSIVSRLSDSLIVALVLAEGLMLGGALGVLLLAWGRELGNTSPRIASCELFAATGFAGAALFALSFAPEIVAASAAEFLPLVSAACLLASQTLRNRAQEDELVSQAPAQLTPTPQKQASVRRLSRKMMMGAALFGLAAGLVETYRSDPGALTTPDFPATLLMLALFCIAVLQTLSAKADDERETFGNMYRIALLVIMAGFLFSPILSAASFGGEAIVLAGYLGLFATFMSLFLAMANISHDDAALVFAHGFTALYAGEAFGIFVANVFDIANPLRITPYAVFAFAGLMVLIAYLFLFTERDFRELSAVVDDKDFAEEARKVLVERAKLSSREAEVLALALKGRTNERIATELIIAKSTADTHLRRIYAKCGVHSRQELIDLGERIAHDLRRNVQP